MFRACWLCVLALGLGVGSGVAQFDLEESHTTASLRGVQSLGAGIAWASGSGGTVLRTEDGGYLWQVCTVPPGAEKLDFRAVQAFDAQTAMVMSSGKGELSRVYRTTDGCQSWQLLFTNPDADGFFDAMVLRSPAVGWILGDPVRGRFALWSFVPGRARACGPAEKGTVCHEPDRFVDAASASLAADPATAGAFAASNSSLVSVGDQVWLATGGKVGAYVYRGALAQAGRPPASWTEARVPVGSGTESSGVFSLAMAADGLAGVAVGGDYQRPAEQTSSAAWTGDGGRSWHAAATMPGGYRSAVAYDSSARVWLAVGSNGADVSVDGGRNWHPLTGSEVAGWNAIALPFVVGGKGRIGRLREGALR